MAKASQKTEAAAPAEAPTPEAPVAAPAAAADESVADEPVVDESAGGETATESVDGLPPHEGELIVPAAPRTVRARVLAYCALGVPNDVIEIEADQVALVGGVIDTSPAAVAYAESLKV